jgi:hypothetical protein
MATNSLKESSELNQLGPVAAAGGAIPKIVSYSFIAHRYRIFNGFVEVLTSELYCQRSETKECTARSSAQRTSQSQRRLVSLKNT